MFGRVTKSFVVGFVTAALMFGGLAIAAGVVQKEILVTYTPLKYVFDGEEKVPPVDQQGFVYNDRTFVSLRFMSESLGKKVGWDPATYTIYVGRRPSPLPAMWAAYTTLGEGSKKLEFYEEGARNLVGVEMPNSLLVSSLVAQPTEHLKITSSVQVDIPLPAGAKTISGTLFVPVHYFGQSEEVYIGHITIINELNHPVYRGEPMTNRSGEIRFSASVESMKKLKVVISLYHNQGLKNDAGLYVAQIGLSDFQIK